MCDRRGYTCLEVSADPPRTALHRALVSTITCNVFLVCVCVLGEGEGVVPPHVCMCVRACVRVCVGAVPPRTCCYFVGVLSRVIFVSHSL